MEFGIYDVIDDGSNIYEKNPQSGNEGTDIPKIDGKEIGIFGKLNYSSGVLEMIVGIPTEVI